jgi:hypothetical protein
MGKNSNNFSKTSKLLVCRLDKDGYYTIGLINDNGRKWKKVHNLVLEAFIGPRPEGYLADHIDRDRTNNNVNNLRWVTLLESNINRDMTNCTGDNSWTRRNPEKLLKGDKSPSRTHPESRPRGSNHWFTKLNEEKVKEIKSLIVLKFEPLESIAARFSTSQVVISSIKNNKTWCHVPWPTLESAAELVSSLKHTPTPYSRKIPFNKTEITLIKFCIAMGASNKECCSIFNTTQAVISGIRLGKAYKDVPWPVFYSR